MTARGEAVPATVTGIASFADVKSLGKASIAIFDLEAARTLFAKDGYDRILVAGRAPKLGGPGTAVVSAREDDRFTLDSLGTFIDILRTVLLAFAAVAVIVGSFTIFNSLSITVAQRTKEFGLLRMVGASRRQVRAGVLTEALVIGLLASTAGIGVGYALAIGLQALFDAVGMQLPSEDLQLATRTIVASLAVGTLATVVAAAIPARRATRIAPVAALREAATDVRPGLFARGVRALASVVGRPSAAIGGASGTLARRNAMRNPGRTAVTASALMIGVMLVTAVTVVAQGLKNESTGALERRVQATSIVTAADGWSPIDPKIERAIPGSTSVRQDGALVFGHQEGVNGVDPATIGRFYRYDLTAGTLDHGRRTGRRGLREGARPARRQRVDRHRDERQDAASSPSAASRSHPCSTCWASARSRSRRRRSTGPSSSAATGSRSRTAKPALTGFPNAKVQDKADFIEGQTAWIGMILAILWVLLALAVIVCLFGIVNTLVLSTFERMRELGTLRALGMNRRQIRRMVRHES